MRVVWYGKKVNDEQNERRNRILPFAALSADGGHMKPIKSLIDNKDTIHFSRYSGTIFPLSGMTSEARLVAPNLYMGPVFFKDMKVPIWYSLEEQPDKVDK